MKRLLFLLIIFVSYFLFPITKYNELNNLAIIDSIGIYKYNNTYTVYLKEIIPVKDQDIADYKFHIYRESGVSLEDVLKKFKSYKKQIFLHKNRVIFTNLKSKDVCFLNYKTLIHTNNVYKKIK